MTHTAALTQAMLDAFAAPAYADAFNAQTRDRWGNSRTRADRRARLLAWQGGLCVKCGEAIDGQGELAHLVAATAHGAPNRMHAGFIYGNISVWHGTCNYEQGDANVRIENLARPDLVFTGTTRDLPLLPR